MPLSISSSDLAAVPVRKRLSLERLTTVMLVSIATILAGAEGVTSAGFDRISKVQRQELAQRRALLSFRDSASSGPHLILLGNSLLRNGVDTPLLREEIGSRFSITPYMVLSTEYYDWFFALRRLFAEGMRPRDVALFLSPNQLASSDIRGDYSAKYLFQGSDLLKIIRDTHMDATTASGFVLSHFSSFYSARVELHSFLLGQTLPSVMHLFFYRLEPFVRLPEIGAPELREIARQRLKALNELCQSHGAQFALVVPPTYQKGAEVIAQAGAEQEVRVLIPVASGELDTGYFEADGFHLNPRGAKVFTAQLSLNLRRAFVDSTWNSIRGTSAGSIPFPPTEPAPTFE